MYCAKEGLLKGIRMNATRINKFLEFWRIKSIRGVNQHQWSTCLFGMYTKHMGVGISHPTDSYLIYYRDRAFEPVLVSSLSGMGAISGWFDIDSDVAVSLFGTHSDPVNTIIKLYEMIDEPLTQWQKFTLVMFGRWR